MNYSPQRIVCLTEEPTELLYLFGEQDRIVGISGFTVRPKQARKEKPVVSTFLDAQIEEILDLKPDLVIGFSDIQAKIAEQLISKGVTVWINNHRSVRDIFAFMVQLGSLVDKRNEAQLLVDEVKENIGRIQSQTQGWKTKPLVYFEEWYDPLITGIQWVAELIELAGGVYVFPEHINGSLAKDRILADPEIVIQKNPDIILASWCGKMFKKKKLLARAGWENIKAVKSDNIYEIKSEIILQPGPAAVIEGLPLLHQLFSVWEASQQKA